MEWEYKYKQWKKKKEEDEQRKKFVIEFTASWIFGGFVKG